MSSLVVDASALLAALQQEPGTERWADRVEGATISTVNISEVIAKLLETHMSLDQVTFILDALNLTVVNFDLDQAIATAQLRGQTKRLGLSLGDRACLALAQTRRLPVLTADRAWEGLNVGIEVNLVR